MKHCVVKGHTHLECFYWTRWLHLIYTLELGKEGQHVFLERFMRNYISLRNNWVVVIRTCPSLLDGWGCGNLMYVRVYVKIANLCRDHCYSRLKIPWVMSHVHLWVLPLLLLLPPPPPPPQTNLTVGSKEKKNSFMRHIQVRERAGEKLAIIVHDALRISCQSAKSMLCGATRFAFEILWMGRLLNTFNWCQSGHKNKIAFLCQLTTVHKWLWAFSWV